MNISKYFFRVPLLSLTLLSSCATMMNGTYQSISVSTNPPNADVWLDNKLAGRSPIILEMERKNDHFMRIELEGYQPYEVTFSRHISGWVAGNLCFGGIIGIALDAVSGALYKLTPDQIQVEMDKNYALRNQGLDQSFILVVLQANPSWEKIDALTPSAISQRSLPF